MSTHRELKKTTRELNNNQRVLNSTIKHNQHLQNQYNSLTNLLSIIKETKTRIMFQSDSLSSDDIISSLHDHHTQLNRFLLQMQKENVSLISKVALENYEGQITTSLINELDTIQTSCLVFENQIKEENDIIQRSKDKLKYLKANPFVRENNREIFMNTNIDKGNEILKQYMNMILDDFGDQAKGRNKCKVKCEQLKQDIAQIQEDYNTIVKEGMKGINQIKLKEKEKKNEEEIDINIKDYFFGPFEIDISGFGPENSVRFDDKVTIDQKIALHNNHKRNPTEINIIPKLNLKSLTPQLTAKPKIKLMHKISIEKTTTNTVNGTNVNLDELKKDNEECLSMINDFQKFYKTIPSHIIKQMIQYTNN